MTSLALARECRKVIGNTLDYFRIYDSMIAIENAYLDKANAMRLFQQRSSGYRVHKNAFCRDPIHRFQI